MLLKSVQPFNVHCTKSPIFYFNLAVLIAFSSAYATQLKNKMYKRQSFEASSTASSEAKDDYEEVLAAIQQELFSHSHMKDVSKSAPCMEITDKNATMIKSIGRSTKSLVNLEPDQKFKIAYCSSEGDSFCAVDSTCATIYRWKKALVKQELFAQSGVMFTMRDQILVPQGCTCVINSMQAGQKSNLPIIIF